MLTGLCIWIRINTNLNWTQIEQSTSEISLKGQLFGTCCWLSTWSSSLSHALISLKFTNTNYINAVTNLERPGKLKSRRRAQLRRRANARNVSFPNSLRRFLRLTVELTRRCLICTISSPMFAVILGMCTGVRSALRYEMSARVYISSPALSGVCVIVL